MFDITPLLQALIGLATTAITAFVIPYIRNRTSSEKLERIKAWAEIGVKAAEQIYDGPGKGEEKKAYVINFLQQHGISVDLDELAAFIESAVTDMKNEQGFLIGTEVEGYE